MMPFSKEQNRRIYITALVISFLLIIGSIYLHLRQKTHLGRMSFHLDSDRIQPTSGVETSTWTNDNDYDSNTIKIDKEKSMTIQPNDENDESEKSSSEEISSGDYSKSFTQDEYSSIDSESDPTEEILEERIASEIADDEDKTCLHCLCMTINECKPRTCSSVPCGKYMISQFYWSDAGKPRVEDETGYQSDSIDHYVKCVNNDNCSQRAVQQYFERYRRDCNKDGIIDCRDQIALHLLGPSGCLRLNVSRIHEIRMNNCLEAKNLNYFDPTFEEESEDNY